MIYNYKVRNIVIIQTITANLCIITMLDASIYLEDGLQESGGLTTSLLANNWDISKLGCAGAVGLIAWFCSGKSNFSLQHVKSKQFVTLEHMVSPKLVVCIHFFRIIQHNVRIMSPKKNTMTQII